MMLIGARGKQETEEGTDMKVATRTCSFWSIDRFLTLYQFHVFASAEQTGVSNTSLDRMAAVDAIQQSLSSFTSAGLRRMFRVSFSFACAFESEYE